MGARRVLLAIAAAVTFLAWVCRVEGGGEPMAKVQLPGPRLKGPMSVEEAIQARRSRRDFSGTPLTLEQMGQLLWCAQGVTDAPRLRRAAPSAGATYPMEVFVAVGDQTVSGLSAGVYRYLGGEHALLKLFDGDVRGRVATAALGQDFLAAAPVDILLAADYGRTAQRYGDRARRYVDMEAGHIGQNVYLQAEALGLGTVAVGAFRDEAVAQVFQLPTLLVPLYLMPVGHTR
jgi:SagB-type dehydrogenase family enzyme